jgi:tetratricopeptide (TPR) repeat protein
MNRFSTAMLALTSALLVGACGAGTPQNDDVRDAATLGLWDFQTGSDEARQQIADGVREFDFSRQEEAYDHFERAIAADPNSAFAHLAAAWASPSVETFVAHLNKAGELSTNANEVERTLVEIYRKLQDGDDAAALAAAQKLAQLTPDNARSWAIVGDMHDNLADREQARANWKKAIDLAPNLATLYFVPSASYTVTEPTDFVKAEALARKAVELEPNEPFAHDVLGDAVRAQGKLDEAAAAYTKAAELDPTKGGPLQQRGHVNTFLGRYAEARADYDAAVALSTGNQKATLAMYRTLVAEYEGKTQGTLDELEQLYKDIDGMNLQEPVGLKMFVGGPQFNIATYYKMIPESERYLARLDSLSAIQAAQAGTASAQRLANAFKEMRHAGLAFAKGDYDAVHAHIATYTKLRESDTNPTKMRPVHNFLGLIALEEKRYEDAVRELEQGTVNSIYHNYELGRALEGAGRMEEAQKMYNKVAHYYFSNEGTALARKLALAKVKATS